MKSSLIICGAALLMLCRIASAAPDIVSARVTDVTTSSFSMVWMTDLAADPAMEIYSDPGMTTPVIDGVSFIPMPDASPDVATAAKAKGIMKVRVNGLSSGTRYYARAVTRDLGNADNVGYSGLMEVTTASLVSPYIQAADGLLQGFANDLITMKVYIRPSDPEDVPGLGDLLLLDSPAASYPLSAFVGVGTVAPEGVIDLNNLFGLQQTTLPIHGGETARINFYRGGTLSTLLHYRRLPFNSGVIVAVEPQKGFFADINLDGKVDEADFELFRAQYRTAPDDAAYNPDYKFVDSPAGKIDAQDFARFAGEYGRTNVPR